MLLCPLILLSGIWFVYQAPTEQEARRQQFLTALGVSLIASLVWGVVFERAYSDTDALNLILSFWVAGFLNVFVLLAMDLKHKSIYLVLTAILVGVLCAIWLRQESLTVTSGLPGMVEQAGLLGVLLGALLLYVGQLAAEKFVEKRMAKLKPSAASAQV
ncbi:hypothetical protein BAUCODRAFT_149357 [Baudoinia panamericana UAMH 10762]|uniref:DUF4203 domain-containing protein n=1 Tax=Baudoinia panamericana (strain UAMH 10762) TaxID=717646 RepID=M2N972_BAUPA|nr:uncharacterized protein BAUCODRAFT_149357 [Baudoinia panamericana UAMH 10762]EMC95370.1 hypothetical protein BAUCODRAFT_149357 [Baudoinia panamericana UAMH 10762]